MVKQFYRHIAPYFKNTVMSPPSHSSIDSFCLAAHSTSNVIAGESPRSYETENHVNGCRGCYPSFDLDCISQLGYLAINLGGRSRASYHQAKAPYERYCEISQVDYGISVWFDGLRSRQQGAAVD